MNPDNHKVIEMKIKDSNDLVDNNDSFNEYDRELDPAKRGRSYAWNTVIGIQVWTD